MTIAICHIRFAMMSPIGTAFIFPATTRTLVYYALTETSQGILSLRKLITSIAPAK